MPRVPKPPTFLSKRATRRAVDGAFPAGTRNAHAAAPAALLASASRHAEFAVARARERERGWWGENSEERVFDEATSMEETRRVSRSRESGEDVETAFRLSVRGLRY